ncbi:AbrB family transcriptional regulator [Paenalkalicoccus suaedae]|uniref:AbrB family transcriptional regulator n=1 Tax=Paenalkalicoccus suaedae TaxID=2592382 RepID=A0A859FEX3_9BACI|nr:AbrB family transcriptional regulator [Paenalkalicoccus suaedae]QKS71252.1 AbrB family transcriptional regulator [Paenalkalicoccus suaedae]
MKFFQTFETLVIALIGGIIFTYLSLPLSWMLGPLTAVMLYKNITKRDTPWNPRLKELGLIVLGISFGLYFTMNTIQLILPYFLPYSFITALLIVATIIMAIAVTRFIKVDKITSVFGSIPGGLTEMVIASEKLDAKPAQVMIFQTIRLLLVLFTVPYAIIFLFGTVQGDAPIVTAPSGDAAFLSVFTLLFILPALIGLRFQHVIPAGIMILPMIITALLHISPIPVASVPDVLFFGAQLCVGVSLGRSISFGDIKEAGKYGPIYAAVAIGTISVSFLLGLLLSTLTTMNVQTAMLAAAPGGLIEMVLTASIVGADPAIVSSLQLMRIIIIITFVPSFLSWYFTSLTS